MLTLAVLSIAVSAAPKVDERLVGTWLAGGAPFVSLDRNGTGSMEEDKVKWSADGKTLIVTDVDGAADTLGYTVTDSTLTLNMNGMPIVLTKANTGAKGKKAGPLSARAQKLATDGDGDADAEAMAQAQAWLQQQNGQPGAAPAPTRGAANPRAAAPGNSQLTQLLLSSAWCSFRYNKVTGSSNTARYQFFRDGTWSTDARGETYNSGANGTVYGQHDSSDRGRWEVRAEQLYMSSGDNPQLQLVQGNITYNSNGSPIINTDGKEYSRCN